jgi:transposase InsO family protein
VFHFPVQGSGAHPRCRCSPLCYWSDRHGIPLEFIQTGNPQQNAYVDRYNRTVRYSWMSQYHFESISEVQDYAARWLNHNNYIYWRLYL